MKYRLYLLLASLCAIGRAGAATGMSEQDYFAELPEVLTVTRLAQPISETPGAVTIIDRDTIRRSGARELVDVLRLVPGYMVGGFNGAHPNAAYHAPLDDYGVRNLVQIDGRSVYSAYYLGDTHRGMMGVLIEDIERIEVLRGSNSAAYGANAMFGVINIITRHAADTRGVEVAVTGGQGGIWDNQARIGWGDTNASFRLSAGRRSDSGYGNAYDDKIISQMHFRGDLRPAADHEVMLSTGVVQTAAADGFSRAAGNPERTPYWRNFYLHGVWQRQLSATDQIKLTASFDEETFRDAYAYAYDPSVVISSSGRGRRANLEFQHQVGLGSGLRVVWGAGYKNEEAVSLPLYNRTDGVSIHEERLFGNIEWRPHPQWLVNAGGFWGSHSKQGSYFSPRLMANFQPVSDHTLRLGMTESTRMPTLFEQAGDVRLYPKDFASLWAAGSTADRIAAIQAFSNLPFRLFYSDGRVDREKLRAQELGYFGNFRDWRLMLDVRAYVEKMSNLIVMDQNGTAPGYVFPSNPLVPAPLVGTAIPVTVFHNASGFKTRGLEYQLRWRPLADTEIWVNQAFERTYWEHNADRPLPPTHATTIAWFQKLPYDYSLSVIHHSIGALSWNEMKDTLPSRRRIDLRLAKLFHIGNVRAEAAVAVQAANGSYLEYQMGSNFTFERRAFGTLRLEF